MGTSCYQHENGCVFMSVRGKAEEVREHLMDAGRGKSQDSHGFSQ